MARAFGGGRQALLTSSAALLFFFLPFRASAQGITVTTQVAPVSALSISDIDFLNATTPKWLFTISIVNNTGKPRIDVTMEIDLQVMLADGETFTDAVSLLTRAFTVESVKNITNLDIVRGGEIRDSVYMKNPDAKRRFEQVALPSGSLPAGSYKFGVTVREVQGGGAGSDMFSIVLTNPSSVELVFPLDGDNTVNPFPLFQWTFDGPRSKIFIYEQLPGQTTREETASGVPILTAEVAATSYQYPSAGVRPLLPGRTYVWYVEGRVPSVGGTEESLKSDLRTFTVAAAGVSSAYSLLDELERALDPKYSTLFDQLRSGGFSPSGVIRLNGSPLSQPDLLHLLDQLRSNPDGVLSVTVE